MALVTQTFPPPTEGVSQQSDDRRRNNQVEDLINGLCDPVRGLQKRPPTMFLRDWPRNQSEIYAGMASMENAHVINRSDDERYIVTFQNSTETPIRVFDFFGEEYIVDYAEGIKAAAIQYLLEGRSNTNLPNKYLKAVTIADYTIICNPNVVVEMTDDLSPALIPQSLVFIRGVAGGRNYGIISQRNGVKTTLASQHAPPAWGMDGASIISSLCFGGNKYSYATLTGSRRTFNAFAELGYVLIDRVSEDESIDARDGDANSLLASINNEASSFDDLPFKAPDGYRVRIRNFDGGELEDYWLQYSTVKSNWLETLAPSLPYKINNQTMPWGLIRQADGTFLVQPLDWADRKTGDDDSNPIPSFIDNKITNIFFYRNRLGFISGENVILSKASEFLDFWYDSAVDILATDPIDEAVPSTSVMTLRHAVPMETDIILFSNDAEYLMRAEGALSPTNIAVDFLSSYQYDVNVQPINIANDIYFINKRGSYSSLYRYTTLRDSYYQKYGDDVSQHVPYYIPNSVRQLIGNTGENFVALLVDDPEELNSIYIYRFIVGEDRAFKQQAWSKWRFENYYKVVFITYLDNFLYIQFQVDNNPAGNHQYEWHRLELTSDTLDLDIEVANEYPRIYADRKMAFEINEFNSEYDPVKDETIIDLWSVYPNNAVEGDYWVIASSISGEPEIIPVEGISILAQGYVVTEGDMQILRAIITPNNATNQRVIWSISDTDVASLNINGLDAFLTTHKPGSVDITCTTEEGGFSDTITIYVEERIIPRETVTITLGSDTFNFNLGDHLVSLGHTLATNFNAIININTGVVVASNMAGVPAINLSGFTPDTIITINNNGTIVGRGGNGGSANESAVGSVSGTNNGDNGTDAIIANGAFTVTINNEGQIFGGGGGGGSISVSWLNPADNTWIQLQAAGGGGAPNGTAGVRSVLTVPAVGVWTNAGNGGVLTGGVGGTVKNIGTGGFDLLAGGGGNIGESGKDPQATGEGEDYLSSSGGAAGNAVRKQSTIRFTVQGSGDIGNIATVN